MILFNQEIKESKTRLLQAWDYLRDSEVTYKVVYGWNINESKYKDWNISSEQNPFYLVFLGSQTVHFLNRLTSHFQDLQPLHSTAGVAAVPTSE